MKKLLIDLKHQIAGNYGLIMDKIFGYSDSHWSWYYSVVKKYL